MRIANGEESKLSDLVRSTKTGLGRGGTELLPICKSTPCEGTLRPISSNASAGFRGVSKKKPSSDSGFSGEI